MIWSFLKANKSRIKIRNNIKGLTPGRLTGPLPYGPLPAGGG